MSHLAISLLGPFRVTLDGDPVTRFGTDTARALLAYLVLHPQMPCRRETLAGLLWPDQPEAAARHSLRQALTRLRTAIGDRDARPPFLHITREALQFNSESDYWLDVAAFGDLTAACRGHRHRRPETCRPCAQRLQGAAALYRGDLFDGFSLDSALFEEWLVVRREELHRQALDVLGHLAGYHEERGEYEQAIGYARRQVEVEPWRESAHRQWMRALALSGQRGAALAQYETCRLALMEELGIEPAGETTALYERIRDGTEQRSSPRHNLPAPLTPFVGREAAMSEIAARLEDPACRLLSLVGPGGIGKTRLALEAAREQLGSYEHGVFLVSLAQVQSVEVMVSTVAQALGFSFYGGRDPRQQLLDYLREKQMLLVLDNFEHLLARPEADGRAERSRGEQGRGDGADLVSEVLKTAPDVKIVITSRTRLNVQSEHLYPVAGMDYPTLPPDPAPGAGRGEPEDAARSVRGTQDALRPARSARDATRPTRYARDATRYSAVRLFMQSARRVRPSYEPTADVAHVGRICRLVGGMPLAILLAASWMDVLFPAEIAERIERGLDFLQTDLRDVPERHRSMRTVFDASWEMLADVEREAFTRLSVFRGGFTQGAAQEVAGAGLRTLKTLVHKCFLQRDPAGRYGVHELLRQYASNKLDEIPGERERTLDRHCAYYAEFLAQRGAEIDRRGPGEALPEMGNIRAGWRRAIARRKVAEIPKSLGSFLGGLHWLLFSQGWFQEGEAIFAEAVDVLQASDPIRENQVALGIALRSQGYCSHACGHEERAIRLGQESICILREIGARQELVLSISLGVPRSDAQAKQLLQESLAICRETGFRLGIAHTFFSLGFLTLYQGAYREAEEHFCEALRVAREIDHPRLAAMAFHGLGTLAYERGAYLKARQFFKEGLARCQEMGLEWQVGARLIWLGDVALAMGAYEEAERRYQEALAKSKDVGYHMMIARSFGNLGNVALAMGDDQRAKAYYRQALEVSLDRQPVLASRELLLALAGWLAQGGDDARRRERAAELVALVLHRWGNLRWVKAAAQKVLDELRAGLPPAALAAAQERGRARDLDATLAELLVELQVDDRGTQ